MAGLEETLSLDIACQPKINKHKCFETELSMFVRTNFLNVKGVFPFSWRTVMLLLNSN